MTINEIEDAQEKRVAVTYRTINLGDGSEDEQESGIVLGTFNGNSSNFGRTIRFEFEPENGSPRMFLFADEILDIEEIN
jgi:hypothetical protein